MSLPTERLRLGHLVAVAITVLLLTWAITEKIKRVGLL